MLLFDVSHLYPVLFVPEPLVRALEVEFDPLGKLFNLVPLPLAVLGPLEELAQLGDLLLALPLELETFPRDGGLLLRV